MHFFILIWTLLPSPMGETQAVPKTPVKMTHFTIDQGLPSNTAYKIIQDSVGYIWLTTQNGLAQFDGREFTVFRSDPNSPGSISRDFVLDVFEDSRKRVWVTGNGLTLYDRESDSFRRVAADPKNEFHFPEPSLRGIIETDLGRLWVSGEESVYYFDPEKEEVIAPNWLPGQPDFPKSFIPRTILKGRGESLWIIAESHLIHIYQGPGRKVSFGMEVFDLPELAISNLGAGAILNENHFLLSTANGLIRFNRETKKFTPFKNVQDQGVRGPNWQVGAVWVRNRNEVWLGNTDGLYVLKKMGQIWHKSLLVPLDMNLGFPTRILLIVPDRNGNVWVSTENQGVFLIDLTPPKFENWSSQITPSRYSGSSSVQCFFEQANGRLLIGTLAGLFEMELGQDLVVSSAEEKPHKILFQNKRIFAIMQDHLGRKWIGTSNGLAWLNQENDVEKWFDKVVTDGSGPHFLAVRALYEDRQGNVWLGYNGKGIGHWSRKDNRFKNLIRLKDDETSISSQFVNCFLEDSQGRFWVGTSTGLNLQRENPFQFRRFNSKEGDKDAIPHEFILCLYEQEGQGLWIGTHGGGLILQREIGLFKAFTVPDGLSSNIVNGILEDDQGHLWLSTNNGICRFDPVTQTFKNFTSSDGLLGMEFNFGAFYKCKDNRMLFGSSIGISRTRKSWDLSGQEQAPPKVVLRELSVNQKPAIISRAAAAQPENDAFLLPQAIDTLEKITLSHKESSISLKFAALQFATPKEVQYSYKLEGFHKDWVSTSADIPIATFTNLDPKEYTFRVKASNRAGVWSHEDTQLQIRVLPPFWQTSWAYLAYAICLLALGYGFVRSQNIKLAREKDRVQQLQQFSKMREVFLTNTSHELRNPLHGIIGLAETLKEGTQNPEETHKALDHIVSCGSRLAHLINDILDFSQLTNQQIRLKPSAVHLHAVAEVVIALVKPLAQHKDLQFENDIPRELPPVFADEDRLFQVLHNLVGNANKYTEKGVIQVNAFQKENQIHVRIRDTGMGIPEEDQERVFLPNEQVLTQTHADLGGIGMGLAITKELLRLHGSELLLQSKLGSGTTFFFNLQLAESSLPLSTFPLKSEPDDLIPKLPSTRFPIPATQPDPSSVEHGSRVLIVDDEPLNLSILTQHLEAHGCSVLPLNTPKKAFEQLEENGPFDLVLIDLMMPGMSGLELSQLIRNKYSRQELPLIILTGKPQQSDLIKAFEIGVNDFLTKPVTKGELLVRIQNQLEMAVSHKKLDEAVQSRTTDLNRALGDLSKQAEILEQQKTKLQELDIWKNRFFTNISHEFRTPLTLLLSPIEDLMVRNASSGDWQQEAPRMLRNGKKILENINQILDLAKIEAKQFRLHYRQEDLIPFLKNCLVSFGPLAETRQLRLKFECQEDSLHFSFDPLQIEKVIFNLLANAIGFSPPGAEVILGVSANDHESQIWVKDQGPGIDKNEQRLIFDRYYQSQNHRSKRNTGTGIGLALCHELITLHAGVLKVDSEPGQGTTLYFTLPRISCVDVEQATIPKDHQYAGMPLTSFLIPESGNEASQNPKTGKKPKILILEDDKDLVAYLRKQLSKDYQILEDSHGDKGITIAKQNLPDLVLCDVLLPQNDGYEICRKLKNDEKTSAIPVILLTGLASQNHKYRGLTEGADDYITKPFHIAELKLRIRNLIQSRQRLKDSFIPLLLGETTHLDITSGDKAFLKRACLVAERHLGDFNFGTQVLADELGMSRRNLHRKIVQVAGFTPGEFIKRFRLQRAALLVRKKSLNISEVAYSIGFRDAEHFAKLFQESFGMLPSKYQKAHETHDAGKPIIYFT